MLPTAGLGVLGLYLDEQQRKQRKDTRRTDRPVSAHRIPNGDNIYNAKRFKETNRLERFKAKDSFEKARNPRETNVIPPHFNHRIVQEQVMKQGVDEGIRFERNNNNNNNNIENFENDLVSDYSDYSGSDNDSVFTDDDNRSNYSRRSNRTMASSNSLDLSDPTALFSASDRLTDNNYNQYKKDQREKRRQRNNTCNKSSDKPAFLSQFESLSFDNPGNPVSHNNTAKNYSSTKKVELERKLALAEGFSNFSTDNDMTYGVVNREHFTHDNQVPFFSGGKGYGNDYMTQLALDNVKDRKRNLFTGSSDYLDFRPKTERRPLFNPAVGLTNIYGMPNFTEFLSARYIPSRERRNEYPVRQVRVTPGLNLGYYEVGKQGYHDTFRPLPKTVDELRTANNQKIQYGGVVIPGMKGYKRPTLPNMYKRKPDTFIENDPRDLQKSLGYIRGPTQRENYDLPATNRDQTSSYWVGGGAARTDQHRPEYLLPLHKRTHRQNYLHPTPRNAHYVEALKAKTDPNSYYVPQNERSSTQFKRHLGPAGNGEYQQGQATSYNRFDVPDPTMRDIHVNKNWVGRANNPEHNLGQGYSFNRNDVPDPTMKDIHVKQNWIGRANNSAYYNGQANTFNRNDVADPTMRDIHVNQNWVGRANNSAYNKPTLEAFNWKDVPEPTMRDLHQDQNWVPGAGPKGQQQGPANTFNRDDVPCATMRDIHQDQNWIPGAGPKGQQQGPANTFNRDDVPEPTMRDVHGKQNWIPGAGPKGQQLGQAHSFNRRDVPDATMRDIHGKQNWIPGAGPKGQQLGQAHTFNRRDIPDPTMRDLHQHQNWIPGAGPKDHQQGPANTFNRLDVPEPTMRDVHQEQNWIPGAGPKGHQKGPASTFNRDDVPEPTMRDIHQNQNWIPGAGPKGHQKGPASTFNRDDVPDPTMRDIYVDKNWLGGASKGVHKGHAFNMNDVPDPTMRDIYIDKNWLGGVSKAVHKGHAFNMKDVPEPTMRDLHIQNLYQQPIKHIRQGEGYTVEHQGTNMPVTQRQTYINNNYQQPLRQKQDGGYMVEVQGANAPVTHRQTYINNTYQQPAGINLNGGYIPEQSNTHVPNTMKQMLHVPYHGPVGNKSHEKEISKGAYMNAFIDDRKQILAEAADRAPTTSNFNKGPTFEYTETRVCEPIQVNRDLYGTAFNQNPLQCVPTVYTQNGDTLPQQSWRFDSHIVDSLQNNPFVNNTQHKAIS
jgi:hypothetical protein